MKKDDIMCVIKMHDVVVLMTDRVLVSNMSQFAHPYLDHSNLMIELLGYYYYGLDIHATKRTTIKHPYIINAWVVVPQHMHPRTKTMFNICTYYEPLSKYQHILDCGIRMKNSAVRQYLKDTEYL